MLVNLRYLRFKLLKYKENNKKIGNYFDGLVILLMVTSKIFLYINSSKKVWKSEFDRLFLPSFSNNRCMFDTIGKTI